MSINLENFFVTKIANKLQKEFPDYKDNCWHKYETKIENKKLVIIGIIFLRLLIVFLII